LTFFLKSGLLSYYVILTTCY